MTAAVALFVPERQEAMKQWLEARAEIMPDLAGQCENGCSCLTDNEMMIAFTYCSCD